MAHPLLALLLAAGPAVGGEDVVLSDFESGSWAGWTVEGEAFGAAPATGACASQAPVSGFLGRGLANSFAHGDGPTGRLASEPFEITRACLRFLVGGGDAGVGVRLEIDGETRFEACGERSESLRAVAWDLGPFRGRRARIVIADEAGGPWGHVLADHFTLTDDRTTAPPLSIGPRLRVWDPSAGREQRFGLNDHAFVRDARGRWHVFAITFTEPGTPAIDGRLFAHATAPALTGPWTREARTLTLAPEAGETRLWAPSVVRSDGAWWMIYHAGGDDMRHARIHLARSPDLLAWQRVEENPVFTDGFQARDPFLLRVGELWHCYYTATFPEAGGHHTVALRTSRDLRAWSESRDVYRDPRTGTDYGPTESPFVVRRGAYWYLFVGSSVPAEYDRTRVFRSRDPAAWAPADLVTTLNVHGAEIVQDEDGRWYASHAGNERGGLWLARLHWNDGLDDAGR